MSEPSTSPRRTRPARGSGKPRQRFVPMTLLAVAFVVVGLPLALWAARGTVPVRAVVTALVNRIAIDGVGRVHISGLTGDPLGRFRLERVRLGDPSIKGPVAAGPWATARDVTVVWQPAALLRGKIVIQTLSAGEIMIRRAPPGRRKPPGTGRGRPIEIRAAEIGALVLAPELAGMGARFALQGRLSSEPGAVPDLALNVTRLDGGDRLTAHFGPGAEIPGGIRFGAELISPRQGFFAHLAGVEAPLRATLHGRGAATGSFSGALLVDGSNMAGSLTGGWDRSNLSAALHFEPETFSPRFALLARLGARQTFRLTAGLPHPPQRGARPKSADQGAFRLTASADNAAIAITGLWDWRVGAPVAPLSVTGAIAGRSAAGLDLPLRFETARFAGRFLPGPAGDLMGDFTLTAPALGSGKHAQPPFRSGDITGALQWPLAGGRFSLAAKSGAEAEPDALEARIEGKWSTTGLDSGTRKSGPAFEFTRGEITHTAGDVRFSGAWSAAGGALTGQLRVPELRKLPGAFPGLRGRAEVSFNAKSTASGRWALGLRGQGSGVSSGGAAIDAILGPAPRLTLDAMIDAQAGLMIDRAAITGRNLRAGATGLLGPRMDMRVEAALRGPVPVGEVEAHGEARLFATLKGPLSAPVWQASAEAAQMRIGALTFAEPRIDLRPVPGAGSRRDGALALSLGASGPDGPVRIIGRLLPDANGVKIAQLRVNYGTLAASGDLAFLLQRGGMSGTLALSGRLPRVGGQVSGALRIAPPGKGGSAATDEAIAAQLTIEDAALPGQRIEHFSLSAAGDPAELRVKGSVRSRGFLPIAFDFSGPARLQDGFSFRPMLRGTIGEESLASAGPLDIRAGEAGQSLKGRITAAGGEILLSADATPASRSAELTATGLSAAMFGRTLGGPARQGRINVAARVNWPETATKASGRVEIRATGLGFAGTRTSGATLAVDAVLRDNLLTLNTKTSGLNGLTATGTARIDGVFAAGPGLTVRPEARIRGAVAANGPIATAWRLLGPRNQRLAGTLTTEMIIDGAIGDPGLAGTLRLSGGEFEDRLLGLRLRALDVLGRYDRTALLIERLTATDRAEGTVQATGRVDFAGKNPALILRARLARFRIADQRLVSAEISGEPVLTLGPQGNLLTGRLSVDRAAFDFSAGTAEAPPAAITVRHVNAPERASGNTGERPAGGPFGNSVQLDLAIQSGERLSARGGNFETQWRGDLRVHGDAVAPLVEGELRLLRGSLDVLGRRFAFVPEGSIRFSGAPEKAVLALAATRNANGLEAIVRVSGAATGPEVRLSSNPVLPEDEILGRILFGRPLEQLGPAEAAQLAAGAATLAAGRALSTRKLFGIRTGLDIGFTPGTEGPGITGGRRLGDRAYVQVTGGPGAQPEIEIEWRARRNLTLVSRFGAEGDSGLALRWRKDY